MRWLSQMNAYFKTHDLKADSTNGYPIPPEWWSRVYEYPWAMSYAGRNMTVADMGCGYEPRPLKDALSTICRKVYAVDIDEGLLTQPKPEGVEFVVADFTSPVAAIPDGSLDRVFCISVLEHLGGKIPAALAEFYRCLRRCGLCILTCDVQYDMDEPCIISPGMDVAALETAARDVGFRFDAFDYDKAGAMYSEQFNLCVYHAVLVKP